MVQAVAYGRMEVGLGNGSVLSDSEGFSCSDCYQVTYKPQNPLIQASVCLHTKGFGLMSERAFRVSSFVLALLLRTASSCGSQSPISLTLAMALAMLARSLMSNHTGSSLPTI